MIDTTKCPKTRTRSAHQRHPDLTRWGAIRAIKKGEAKSKHTDFLGFLNRTGWLQHCEKWR